MARRGKRVTVAPGIYKDATGYETVARGGGLEEWKRFEHGDDPKKDIKTIQRWQATTKAELLGRAADLPSPAARGSLVQRHATYLKRREGRKGYKSDRSHLAAWEKTLGRIKATKITPEQCENLIATWRSAGLAEKTIRHRVRVFKEAWHASDGKKAVSPVDGIKLPKPVQPSPRPVSADVIRAVAASLRAGLTIKQRCGHSRNKVTVKRASSPVTYARFLVRALTGQRADQIMHTKPGDVDLEARIWWVRPAKGGNAIPFPLNDEQIVAWRIFFAAPISTQNPLGAWGDWDWRSFSKTLKRHGWPEDIPPKNLRHTFAIDHLLAGTDLGDLQGLLGHANVQTTRTFYAPVLVSRLAGAMTRRTLDLVPPQATKQTPPAPPQKKAARRATLTLARGRSQR